MSTLEDVAQAIQEFNKCGIHELVLLQCTSNYPVAPENVNLLAMRHLRERFGLPVGLSDHTLGMEVAMAATALGACVVEKHFTLDNTLPGPDHLMSLEPVALKKMVDGIRIVESALGDGLKKVADCERDILSVARKSMHYSKDLRKGMLLSEDAVVMLRPSHGVPPNRLGEFVGMKLIRDVFEGEMLDPDDFIE
jgi:sialic acid synthase SpsE